MPLVKQGRIATDLFVHVVDGGELPDDGAILVSAARFLEDPEAVLKRTGKVGVIWPNNRDLDDLVPYLDRVAAVALVPCGVGILPNPRRRHGGGWGNDR